MLRPTKERPEDLLVLNYLNPVCFSKISYKRLLYSVIVLITVLLFKHHSTMILVKRKRTIAVIVVLGSLNILFLVISRKKMRDSDS